MGIEKGHRIICNIMGEEEITKEEILKYLKLPLRIVESRANDLKHVFFISWYNLINK